MPLVMLEAFVVSTVADGASPDRSAALPLVATFARTDAVAAGPSVTPPIADDVAACIPLIRVTFSVVALIVPADSAAGDIVYAAPFMLNVIPVRDRTSGSVRMSSGF